MSLLARQPRLLPNDSPHGQERLHIMTNAPSSAESKPTSPTPGATGNNEDDALIKFGAKVREFRKARGLTQHQLAESAGIDRKTINRIENTRYSPTLTNVFAIAEALDIPANTLL